MVNDDVFRINEEEIMEYYGYSGTYGRLRLRCKFLKTWLLHRLAYSTPLSNFAISMQRSRGVKIGKNCHISPYVLIDLLYPHLVTIEDNVTEIGRAHV